MPPNLRRYMPLILIAFVLLLILPTLLKKKTSSAVVSGGTRAAQTIDAMTLIDKGEQDYLAKHGRFTAHIADLISSRLASDLATGLTVQLDVGSDGHHYLAQVASGVLNLVRGRNNSKVTAQSCFVVKSGSGVACPSPIK